MAAAASARLCSLGFVEVYHFGVGLVYELADRPCVLVAVLLEADAGEICAVLVAGEDVHISLVALIDPLAADKFIAADGAQELADVLIRECDGLALKPVIALVYDCVRPGGLAGDL